MRAVIAPWALVQRQTEMFCQPQTFAAEGDGDGVPAGGLVGFDEEEESVIDTLGMSVDGCAGPRVAGVLEG